MPYFGEHGEQPEDYPRYEPIYQVGRYDESFATESAPKGVLFWVDANKTGFDLAVMRGVVPTRVVYLRTPPKFSQYGESNG